MTAFGKRLELELEQREDMNQRELARRLGVSPQAVNGWIKGNARPGWGRVQRIEDELKIPRGELMELLGYKPDDGEPARLVTIEDAIKADPDIESEDKRALLRIVAGIRRAG